MRFVLSYVLAFFISFSLISQEGNKRRQEIKIKTSAECKFCKEKIEAKLIKLKGIRKVNVDFIDHTVKVEFNSRKINADEIRAALNEMGYDADDKKAGPEQTKGVKHKPN